MARATLLALCLLGLHSAFAAPLSSRDDNPTIHRVLKPEMVQAIEALLLSSAVPGMTIAITTQEQDELVHFGNATIFGSPVTDETYWSIGSNSKLFTAVVLAMLSEDDIPLPNGGTYKLDTPLIDFMPDFKMVDDNATQHATTLDLLSHSSGLPTHNYAINDTISTKGWYDLLAHLAPTAPFRTLFQYSNVNYAASGYIVELLTGQDFYDVVQERIIEPTGLEVTFNLSEAIASGTYANGFINMDINATQCAMDSEALANATGDSVPTAGDTSGQTTPAEPSPPSCFGRLAAFSHWTKGVLGQDYGAGGFVNLKARELLRWARAMTHAEGIPQSIIDIVDTPRFPAVEPSQYNMGSYTADRHGNRFVYHGGSVMAHSSIFGRMPDRGLGVYIISNSVQNSARANQAVLALVLDDLVGGGGDEEDEEGGDEGTSSADESEEYPPIPTDPRPPPQLSDWLDRPFLHSGYGQLTLSLLNMSTPAALEAVGLPPKFIALDLTTAMQHGTEMYAGQALYAHYGQTLAEHLIFTHFDGPLYNFTIVNTYPSVDPQGGEDARLGQLLGQGRALFEEGNIGLYDWVLGDASLPKIPLEEGNIEGAEVVFSRD